jgi:hypothetical protein
MSAKDVGTATAAPEPCRTRAPSSDGDDVTIEHGEQRSPTTRLPRRPELSWSLPFPPARPDRRKVNRFHPQLTLSHLDTKGSDVLRIVARDEDRTDTTVLLVLEHLVAPRRFFEGEPVRHEVRRVELATRSVL